MGYVVSMKFSTLIMFTKSDITKYQKVRQNFGAVASGEAALPEGNSSGPERTHVALSVRWEGEEGAEPRKVSGQPGVSFASSFLLPDSLSFWVPASFHMSCFHPS